MKNLYAYQGSLKSAPEYQGQKLSLVNENGIYKNNSMSIFINLITN